MSNKLKEMADGWFNVLTGLGKKNKDKRVNAGVVYNRHDQEDLESKHDWASFNTRERWAARFFPAGVSDGSPDVIFPGLTTFSAWRTR